jgi:2-C-methyl-D-erythritol 4-phosphate cytidylyltransferase
MTERALRQAQEKPQGERVWVVVPAAGVGKRMGAAVPKQYLPVAGRTVLEHAIHCFYHHPGVRGIVVAVSPGDPYWAEIAPQYSADRLSTTAGGAERCHSVLSGLQVLLPRAQIDDWVMVHDAARPCLTPAEIGRMIAELGGEPVGGILAVPVRDTLKRAGPDLAVAATVDRQGLWAAMTPQMFRLGALIRAMEEALAQGVLVTDEAQAMELAGFAPLLVEGSVRNIKITRPEDQGLAELYLRDVQARIG